MHCVGCDNIPFWRWLKGILIRIAVAVITSHSGDGLKETRRLQHLSKRNAYQSPFKPSPEWDIITATAMRIKIPLSHLQNGIL
jgi:hypothetical protein